MRGSFRRGPWWAGGPVGRWVVGGSGVWGSGVWGFGVRGLGRSFAEVYDYGFASPARWAAPPDPGCSGLHPHRFAYRSAHSAPAGPAGRLA
ncbi:hypothetical protein FGK60_30775 [Streptomyces sp. DASNCL29]|nr:hypothetical protein FGK60_30775 [Streptomyces sp. DASNCL29]